MRISRRVSGLPSHLTTSTAQHELQAFDGADSRFFVENTEKLGSAYRIKGAWIVSGPTSKRRQCVLTFDPLAVP